MSWTTNDAERESANGRAYIIFGGTGTVGKALSKRLANDGARLVIVGRRLDRVQTIAHECHAQARVLDARHTDDVDNCIMDAVSRFGRLDGVVNCIGSNLMKPAHLTSESEWHYTLDTNLSTAYAVVHAAVKAMKDHGGAIVLLSSALAQVGVPNNDVIAAVKAGVEGFTRGAAATYAHWHIRVNAVAQGVLEDVEDVPRSAGLSTQGWERLHAAARLGRADEVAAAIVWLLDPLQEWVTGQVVNVDGGLSRLRTTAES